MMNFSLLVGVPFNLPHAFAREGFDINALDRDCLFICRDLHERDAFS